MVKINIIYKWKQLNITTKSIIICSLISIVFPILLLLIQNLLMHFFTQIEIQFDKTKRIDIYNQIVDLQAPAFIEYHYFSYTFLWVILRFGIIITLSYLNGLLLLNIRKILKFNIVYVYLILTSLIIYFLTLYIAFYIGMFLANISYIDNFLQLFSFFGI